MRNCLYYQHTLKLLVLESSLVILACTVSSPTFCVVGLCLLKISRFLRAKCRPRAITRSQVSAQIPAAIFQSLVRDREQILKICVGMIGPIKGGV